MGSQRLAAVAAVSHGKHLNNTTPDVVLQTGSTHYTVNIFFLSATLCGVLVAVCAACWRRSPRGDKPEDAPAPELRRSVYTVSVDATLAQVQDVLPGPPPAYETVVDVEVPSHFMPSCSGQDVVKSTSCPQCRLERCDSGLPSYEAAVMLKDTKL